MKKHTSLRISKLFVSVLDKPILHDINLEVIQGTIHAIMGPNGSGKSSLAYALMGHPDYSVQSGSILLNNSDLCTLSVHERAKKGLFLAFQHPYEIPGVSVASFLKEAYTAVTGSLVSVNDFQALLHQWCEQLEIDSAFLSRGLNEGFSGGEKKRLEVLQLFALKPTIAVLDEIDSGLDIDSLKIVANGLALARKENPHMSIIVITHYQRILDHMTPDYVHILCEGRIVASGTMSIVHTLESRGYDAFKNSST